MLLWLDIHIVEGKVPCIGPWDCCTPSNVVRIFVNIINPIHTIRQYPNSLYWNMYQSGAKMQLLVGAGNLYPV